MNYGFGLLIFFTICSAVRSEIIADSAQKVGGGGHGVVVPYYIPDSENPKKLAKNMVFLKKAEIVLIQNDANGKPYLLVEEEGQTYRIRNFPSGKYVTGAIIPKLFIIRGRPDKTLGDRYPYLWISTNKVTQSQILEHETSPLGGLYPIN